MKEYMIETTNCKGIIKEVKIAGINNESYKNMMETYRKFRDDTTNNSNDIVEIRFYGIEEGNKKMYFIKTINPIMKESVTELCNVVINAINKLNQKSEIAEGMVDLYTKKASEINHYIENHGRNVEDEEKIRMFDSLCDINMERREMKNENKRLHILNTNLFNIKDLPDLGNRFNKVIRLNENIDNNLDGNCKKYDDINKNIHEYYYGNEDKNKLKKRLNKEYDRVIDDSPHKMFKCYSQCMETKLKNRNKQK